MKKSILTAIALSSIALTAQAATISLNFARAGTPATVMTGAETAGVVAVSNWNSATDTNANSAAGVPLNDSGGVLTTAVAGWTSGSASWSTGVAGTGSADNMLMMTGYLDQGGNGLGQIHMISITNIPYANYDVYLYHSSSGGADRTARYQANGADIWTRNLNPANTFNGFTQAGYTSLADAANTANPAGNYVLWTGLSGDLTIEGQGYGTSDGGAGGDTRRAPIQGIQIVERIPEPGSALLLLVGSVVALVRRRR
jgi:hypothetical protein